MCKLKHAIMLCIGAVRMQPKYRNITDGELKKLAAVWITHASDRINTAVRKFLPSSLKINNVHLGVINTGC